jgi:hypothetical protein
MPDQLQDIVARMVASGESEQDIALVIQQMSHQAPQAPKRPEEIGASFDPNHMDTSGIGERAMQRLPAIAAGATAVAAGPGIILPAIAAGGAGYLGARVRGDSREDAAVEGLTQGAMQGVGGVAAKGGRVLSRGIMRGGIPKNIQSEFGGKAVADEALDTLAIPGSARSAARVSRLSHEANQGLNTAAAKVPTMKARKIIDGIKPLHDAAVSAKIPGRAQAIANRAGEIRREVGSGLDGPGQLARNRIKGFEGKAAMNAPSSNMAGLDAQLADAERDAVMKHLHETPGMKDALGLSQRRMGLDRWMKDSENTSMLLRARQSLPAAALSPTGLSVTAHGVNQGSRAVSPEMLRAIQIAMLNGEQQ